MIVTELAAAVAKICKSGGADGAPDQTRLIESDRKLRSSTVRN
jgi:hypothetical protein